MHREYVLKVCESFGYWQMNDWEDDLDIYPIDEVVNTVQHQHIDSENGANMTRDCKILIIGAGGIGCELVKVLASSGFTNIEIVSDSMDCSHS